MRISGYISSSISAFVLALAAVSCSFSDVTAEGVLSAEADIYPDYRNVTVPCNIAPLNFNYVGESCDAAVLDIAGIGQVKASRDGLFKFSAKTWKRICSDGGAQLTVLVKNDGKWMAHPSFRVEVSNDPIDPYVAYRLIPPGYQGWKSMGIYQRDLTSYRQSAMFDNSLTNESCMNCHSFNEGNPEQMIFHNRASFAGTVHIDGSAVEKLNTKTGETISAFVYPYWHPDGIHVAFSVNKTFQSFFAHNPDRIEVFDQESDVVVYNTITHEVTWSDLTFSDDQYETFPCFSPDGRYLYFTSADAVEQMPADYRDVHYSIKRIAFDPETETFSGELETIYDANATGKSASFPRISRDGRFLAFTEHGFGNFSIWHSDSDIRIIDLLSDTSINNIDSSDSGFDSADSSCSLLMEEDMNSDAVDSYHSWSSNSRWMIFSSRRDDGLYTRPYICHIDENGVASKAFMMPQKNPAKYYAEQMFSYNIPELIKGRVKTSRHTISQILRNTDGVDVSVKH